MAKLAYIECGSDVKLYVYANTSLYNELVSRYEQFTVSHRDRITVPTLDAHNPPDDATLNSIMTSVSATLFDTNQIWRNIPIKYIFRNGLSGKQLINQTDFVNIGTRIFYNSKRISYDTNFSVRRTNIYYNGSPTGSVIEEWIQSYQTDYAEGPYYADGSRSLLGYGSKVEYASDSSGNGAFRVAIPVVPESCIDTGVFTLPPNFDTSLNTYKNYYYIEITPDNQLKTNWVSFGKFYLNTTTYNQLNNDSSPYMTGVLIGAPVTLVAQDDPYTPDNNEGEGGTGDNDTDSDVIPEPIPPSVTPVATGFIAMYKPTLTSIQLLASKMYSDTLAEAVRDYFVKPLDAIMSLSYLPVTVPTAGNANVIIGNYDTGVEMAKVSGQYITYNMGSVKLNEFWGNFADYNPLTKINIYLPYIGVREVNTDDVMTSTNYLTYKIDLLTGSCLALLKCVKTSDNKQGELNSILYSWNGNVATQIPVSQNTYQNWLGSILNGITTGIGTGLFNPALGALAGSAVLLGGAKRDIKHSDIIPQGTGNLNVQVPYFIINRPIMAKPSNYNTFYGLPSIMNRAVLELAGWSEFDEVRVNIQIATDEEKAELTELLKTGVFL